MLLLKYNILEYNTLAGSKIVRTNSIKLHY